MAELTEYDEIRLKEIFELLDLDKCGVIDSGDLRTGCQLFGLNPSPDDLELAKRSVLSEDETINEGAISYQQFCDLSAKLYKSNEEIQNELDVALCVIMEELGLNKDDKISKDALKAILQVRGDDQLTEEEVDEVFHDINTDGNTDCATRKQLVELFTRDF